MRTGTTFIFLLFLTIASLNGQDVTVSAAFDSTKILIGDQVHFNITINQPSDLKLQLPVLKDTLSKNIQVLSGPVIDTATTSKGKIRITEKYLTTSFDSGHFRINPVYAELTNPKGIKRFYSDYSVLEVARVKIAPPDTTMKIFDIVKPYSAPVTFGEILPWVLIALLAGIIIFAVIRFVRIMREKKQPASEPLIKDPAHVIAFHELEKLKSENLWQRGETKKYYTRLTEILRQYLEDRYGIYSLELTTSETLDALVKSGFKKDGSYSRLKSVLTGADLVKFAKYKPEPAENEASFDESWNFVGETRQEEQPDLTESNIERKDQTDR